MPAATWAGRPEGPIPEAKDHIVRFGKVEGENRGPNPMVPPLERTDKYFWLRDDARTSEPVLSHLRDEATYLESKTAAIQPAAKAIYEEHVGRLKETDVTCPCRKGPWETYRRTIQGLSYPIHCRRPRGEGRVVGPVPEERGTEAGEQELLDVNVLAKGHAQCCVGSVETSPSHGLLAFTVDFKGNEVYELQIRKAGADPSSSEPIDTIPCSLALDGSFEWGLDDTSIYYSTRDEQLRSFRVYRHVVGTDSKTDELIQEEPDEVWSIGMGKSLEGFHLVIGCGSTESSEARLLDLRTVAENDKKPAGERASLSSLTQLVRERTFGVRYSIEGISGTDVYLSTNADGCINEKVVRAPLADLSNWSDVVVPHDPEVKIDSVDVFRTCMTVEGRQNGLTQVWVVTPGEKGTFTERRRIEPPEPIYSIGVGAMEEFDAPTLRLVYNSLTTPAQTWEIDPKNPADRVVVKEKVVHNYDPSRFVSERRQATAPDGTKIDISVVRRKDLDMSVPQPTLLYGYGSYGICIDPDFSMPSLAYLERGVVYCIAHIRGGGENGRAWYEKHGKYLTKRNTFHDFISAAESLVDSGLTKPELLAIEGRSAGGLLMGAVVNMRPDLFKVCIAGVPFVDVMTTMCDPSIPLTTGEWEEWGNPNEFKYFDYMLSYSPMDNVRPQPYPNMLIVAGLHDPRVAYWEPAKWAVRLREASTAKQNDVLVKMDMEVGHFSASDRYKHLKEKAFEQSYVLSKIAPKTII